MPRNSILKRQHLNKLSNQMDVIDEQFNYIKQQLESALTELNNFANDEDTPNNEKTLILDKVAEGKALIQAVLDNV